MTNLTLPEDLARSVRASQIEEVLQSMLARERPKKGAFETEAEMVEWFSERTEVALSLILMAATSAPEMLTILPIGSIAEAKLLGKTKKRGPQMVVDLPSEALERLQDEDPSQRDLYVLVVVDNHMLRDGTSRVVRPTVRRVEGGSR